MGRSCRQNRRRKNVFRIFIRKPIGKRSLGRPRRRWEDIKMDLTEIGIKRMNWIYVVVDDRDQ